MDESKKDALAVYGLSLETKHGLQNLAMVAAQRDGRVKIGMGEIANWIIVDYLASGKGPPKIATEGNPIANDQE